MDWIHYVAYFFGGAFLTNAIPHSVSGMMGQGFPSPFAKPPGKGLSSSIVNVLWGAFNVAVSYLLIFRVGSFDIHDLGHIGCVGLGSLLISLQLAYHFGQLFGGRTPRSPELK